jgi:prolyl oligopeptidase PreP (S9A serine peptidase family)
VGQPPQTRIDDIVEVIHGVQVHDAQKMTARLQAAGDSEVLLRVEPRAGHGQGKPASKVVLEETDVWTFLLEHLRG